MRVRFRVALAANVAVLASVVSACGGTGATTTVTVTKTAAAPNAVTPTAPDKKSTPTKARPKADRASGIKACDANISVKVPHTTCPFAENVFYSYWLNEHEPGVFADSPGLPAYSPAADQMFYVHCSGKSTVICRAGDGGYVTFPMAAVSAYTQAQARKYAKAARLGDVPAPDPNSEDTTPLPSDGSEGSGDCDPNYDGACLNPDSPDYDCEGGSGDGPDYTGSVTVVGDDHYGLDRDGDGVGCEG